MNDTEKEYLQGKVLGLERVCLSLISPRKYAPILLPRVPVPIPQHFLFCTSLGNLSMAEQSHEGNGLNVEKVSLESVIPRVTVDPESRRLRLLFETSTSPESDQSGLRLTLSLSVPEAFYLMSGLLDALQKIEPLDS